MEQVIFIELSPIPAAIPVSEDHTLRSNRERPFYRWRVARSACAANQLDQVPIARIAVTVENTDFVARRIDKKKIARRTAIPTASNTGGHKALAL